MTGKRIPGLVLLLLIAATLAGCANQTRLVRDDIYARNVVFTVASRQPDYQMMNAGFDARPLASSPTGLSTANTADAEPQVQTVIQAVLQFHQLRKVSQFSLKALGVEAVVAEIGPQRELTDVITALATDTRVESVQKVSPYKLLSYNDPYFALQNTVNGDSIEHIHEITTGKNVTVGIVDTGVDRWHPELAGRIVYSGNFVAHDQESFDLDEHGTAVAGVIGSAANNDLGIVGVAPDVRMMVFKACHQELASRRTSCDSVSLIKALNQALQQNPDVLNLSLSGPRDPIIERLLREASRRGMVLVAAVDEARGKSRSFPAAMPEVIAVGTSVRKLHGVSDVVLAPGTDMLTTAPGATYGFKSGSSMAAAYVSGIAALMKEKVPALTGTQIQDFLRVSARLDENQLPVVDMCTAVNHAANTAYQACSRPRSMAVNVDPEETTDSYELTN